MKKQITILLFLIIQQTSRSQNSITITTPCNDALLQKTHGRWVKDNDILYNDRSKNKQEEAEVIKRLDAVHQLLLNVYPEPVGVDAAWHRSIGDGLFATNVTYYIRDQDQVDFNIINGVKMAQYVYTCGFFRYSCKKNKNAEPIDKNDNPAGKSQQQESRIYKIMTIKKSGIMRILSLLVLMSSSGKACLLTTTSERHVQTGNAASNSGCNKGIKRQDRGA